MADNAQQMNIFVDSSGRPLHVFVETSEFAQRPKLIRDLRRDGAMIAHYPSEAQIILVDMETNAGKQFVNDWGAEPGKVVLRWEWVHKSTQAGKALLVKDNWGGCRQLPRTNGHVALVDHQQSVKKSSAHSSPDIADPPPQLGSNMTLQAALQALSQGQNIPSTSSGLDPSDIQLPFGIPVPQVQPNSIPLPTQNTIAHIPAHVTPELLNALAILQNTNPTDLQSLLTQLNVQGSQVPNVPMTEPALNYLEASDGPQPRPLGLDASDFMSPSSSSAATRTPRPSFRRSSDPPSSIPAKRRQSKGGTPSSSISSRSKGKERAHSPEPPFKQRRRSDSFTDDDDDDDGDDNDDTSSSFLPAPDSLRNADEVFVHDNGEPVVFWVQMETKQRGDLLQLIKRNKGRIVAELQDADLAVLAQNSKPFPHWLKVASQADKTVIQSRYIQDCVKRSALLDTHDFGFDELPVPQRGRPRKNPQVTTPKKASAASSPTKAKAPSSAGRSSKPIQQTTEHASSSRPILYTADEWEYVQLYVRILLARDPDMSQTAMGDTFHEKMPHHTIKSWRSWLSNEKRSEFIKQARKRAFIERRKAQQMSTSHPDSEQTNGTPAGPPGPPASVSEASGRAASDYARDDDEVWECLAKEGPSRTAEQWQLLWGEKGAEINEEVRRRLDAEEAAMQANQGQ
ncbi:uncharacterized protein B0H18DRAFT_968781 [Fomitopsis serialis]|uniref:uncharacterized protein n=1 Tax=Fomitopsis serialis TaxID=139415 RepID=UPI002008273C|nr:uncharacterized protein B0H18DRAFT_968781 [Neoantrodia serialis]KAH9937016.1 hypothetical protein B0H18DRAFT_968781 [Neoantrodia serialis]